MSAASASPSISPEDLVVAKVLAARTKDLEDIEGVLRERLPQLDLWLIRATLRELEAALGQSDLLPSFEDILGASNADPVGQAVRSPPSAGLSSHRAFSLCRLDFFPWIHAARPIGACPPRA